MPARPRCVYVVDPGYRAPARVAVACGARGILGRYITSFHYDPFRTRWKLIQGLPSRVRDRVHRFFLRRHVPGLHRNMVLELPVPELVGRLALLAPAPGLEWYDHWVLARWHSLFDASAASAIPIGVTHVYASQGSAARTLAQGRKLGATTILEATQHPGFLEEVLRPEYDRLGLRLRRISLGDPEVDDELNEADVVVTQSAFASSTYSSRGVASSKLTVVPLGVDLSMFRVNREVPPGSGQGLRVLYVGRLSVRKGIAYLLDAIRQLDSIHLELRLVGLMDREFSRPWKQMRSAVRSPVVWLGGLSKRQLATEYAQADVVVLPSLCDSFGQTALEGMAAGTPAIVTDACGVPVRDGYDGFRVTAGRTEAIASAIEACLNDRDALREMGQHASRTAMTYSWERFQSAVLALLYRADHHLPRTPTQPEHERTAV